MIIKGAPALAAAGRCRRPSSAKPWATSTKRSARLNRIVNDVLDFARPLHFDLAPTDLGAPVQ